MKALIISDDTSTICRLDDFLTKQGFGTIIYRWLLKALDNIEEIRPDCVIVSSSEYPRHWKTLVQFVKSGIGGDNVDIYLYEPTPVSQEDEEKAKILGVTGCFSQFSEFEELVKPEESVVPEPVEGPAPEATPVESPVIENAPEPSLQNTGHFMFTHPASQNFISGKFFDYNGKTLSCIFYNFSDLRTVNDNMEINTFSFFDSQKTRSAKAVIKNIMDIMTSNPFVIVEIQEIYDEN